MTSKRKYRLEYINYYSQRAPRILYADKDSTTLDVKA